VFSTRPECFMFSSGPPTRVPPSPPPARDRIYFSWGTINTVFHFCQMPKLTVKCFWGWCCAQKIASPEVFLASNWDHYFAPCSQYLLEFKKILVPAMFTGKVWIQAKWPIRSDFILVSIPWSHFEYFYTPLEWMLVHCRVTHSIKVNSTHLYMTIEKGTVSVKCLAQEHNVQTTARAQTWNTRSRDERTNHEATIPLTVMFTSNGV